MKYCRYYDFCCTPPLAWLFLVSCFVPPSRHFFQSFSRTPYSIVKKNRCQYVFPIKSSRARSCRYLTFFLFSLFFNFSFSFLKRAQEPSGGCRRHSSPHELPCLGHEAPDRPGHTVQGSGGSLEDMPGWGFAAAGGAGGARGDATDEDPCRGMPARPRRVHGKYDVFSVIPVSAALSFECTINSLSCQGNTVYFVYYRYLSPWVSTKLAFLSRGVR